LFAAQKAEAHQGMTFGRQLSSFYEVDILVGNQ
jgi:hypothetical protein